MKIIAEVDEDFFKKKDGDGPRRMYLSFDRDGCKYLIDILSRTYKQNNKNSSKLMPEDWGMGELSSSPYFGKTRTTEIFEITLID